MFYKSITDNILMVIGESSSIIPPDIEITEQEYNSIMAIIQSKPADTEDTIYMLHADTMTYEPHEAPEPIEPIEPTNPYGIDDELYNSIIDDYTMELLEGGIIE